jgi:uncharacterized protein (DUF1330 family)
LGFDSLDQKRGAEPVEKLEGDWELPERVSILKFPTVEQAKAWWDDPEYAELKKARQASTTGRVMLVEGMD